MNVKFRLISEDETNKIKKRKRKKEEEEDLSMFHVWDDFIEKYKFNIIDKIRKRINLNNWKQISNLIFIQKSYIFPHILPKYYKQLSHPFYSR